MAFARRPPGLLGGQRRGHGRPVIQGFSRQQLAQGRQAGLMTEQLAQSDGLLAGSGKLRPVAGHRHIQLQLAFPDQLQGGHGGKGLGAGKQVEDGVAVPGLLAVLVGHTGPQVEHRFATDLHAQGATALLRIVEQLGEGVFKCFELEVEIALNLHAATPVARVRGGHCCSLPAALEPPAGWVAGQSGRRIRAYGALAAGAGKPFLSTLRLALRTCSTKPWKGRSVMPTSPR